MDRSKLNSMAELHIIQRITLILASAVGEEYAKKNLVSWDDASYNTTLGNVIEALRENPTDEEIKSALGNELFALIC